MQKRIDVHGHTRYSNARLIDALATPEAYIDRAIQLGLSGVAITDHELLGAHPKANKYFYESILPQHPDFKVILGNEIYLVDERPCDKHYHFILLAKDAIGHKQLRILSSKAWLNMYNAKGLARVDTLKADLEDIVKNDPGHLIASTACIGGELGANLLAMATAERALDTLGEWEAAEKIDNFLLWCKYVFGEDFYIECQPGVSKDQIRVNKKLPLFAKKYGVKMIVTSDTHFLKPEDRYVHKSYLNSKEGDREVDAFYADAYMHSEEEIYKKLGKSGYSVEFVQKMFENSMEIYDKISNYSLHHSSETPKPEIKYYPPVNPEEAFSNYSELSRMFTSNDETERYWINECVNALKKQNKFTFEYLDELEEEAEVKTIIGKSLDTNMFRYPILMANLIDTIWSCGSTVGVGRGSACSALNHYLLGITQLDPLIWNFPFFRYMNRERLEIGDIDIDVCPSKVQTILKEIKKERSKKFLPEIDELSRENLGAVYVCTYGTESTKAAILSACRGYRSKEYPDGIDNDTAQYLSSLIPVERGFVWSFHDVYYGNPDKDRKPITTFINEVNSYPGLFEVMLGIEGVISQRGRHASGVLLMDEDPYKFNCFMKTPAGEVVTQYDLHDAEWCGSVKIDLLVTDIQDKEVQTIKFLQESEEIDSSLTLKEAYYKYIHPDVLNLNHQKTWEVIQNAASLDLFQLDSPIGRQGAKKIRPTNMQELSATNGLIRLMRPDNWDETPMERYLRFKREPRLLESEMIAYGLTASERETLNKYLAETFGIGISQEQMMRLLMDENICDFSLKEANAARKVVGKKQMNKIPALKQSVFEKAKTPALANYVWDYGISSQMGYSFSDIHSMSYSFIGFQSAYLATKWNPIYWNTACLVVNSGALGGDKDSSTDYVKLAKAIGNIRSHGIKMSLVDINSSDYSFKPDIKNNQILFGLKGLNRIGDPVIEQIMAGRPYSSICDFMNRCPLNKTAMISLIKAGAFDNVDFEWASKLCSEEPRMAIMTYYLSSINKPKTKLTLQNFSTLIKQNCVPDSLNKQKYIFTFNKYLKQFKVGNYYKLDETALAFYQKQEFPDELEVINGNVYILQKTWDKIYSSEMDHVREWLANNQTELISHLNFAAFEEEWNKYADGSISAWEMESLCFYHHPHELAGVRKEIYGISDFFNLPTTPVAEKTFRRNGRDIPIFKLTRIIGTVIGKDDSRSSISLLTPEGVVNVKFTRDYYAMYSKQISEKEDDGKKSVREKGWFIRGSKLMVQGFRRDDTFVAKNYKSTGEHQLYKIINVYEDGQISMTHSRYGMGEDE